MAARGAVSPHFLGRFLGTLVAAFAQLVRSPSHSRRAEAGRRAARHVLWLVAGAGAAIIVLMYLLDVAEIQMMPKRGTPSLWWVRILTDFGKSEYVLWTLFALMVLVLVASAAMRGTARALLLGLGTRLQFLFFAVLTPVLPVVMTWRVTRTALDRGRHRKRLVEVLPLILLLHAVWALGEFVGYLTADPG